MLLGGGILAPSTGRGIEKFPSLRNSPCFGRGRANRKEPNYFLFADQLDGIESITSILWFVQLAPPPPKLLLPTNRWRQVLSAGVTTTDVNRNSDSRNQCDTRRLAKCAIVSVPTHKAILPCVCLRSLTTRAGCGEPCTYKRALSPCTSIFSLVHSPGTTSA